MLRIHSHTSDAVATLRRAALLWCMLPTVLTAVAEDGPAWSSAASHINRYIHTAEGDTLRAAEADTIYADQLLSAEALRHTADGGVSDVSGVSIVPNASRSPRSSRSSNPSLLSAAVQPLHRAPRVARASAVPASQCLLDSIIGYDHDGAPVARTYYKYDTRRYQTLEEAYTLTNGTWVGKSRTEHAYDGAGNPLLDATYTWRNGAWAGSNKTTYTYDAAGRNTDMQAFLWSSSNADWTNNYRYTYTYDAAGNLVASFFYSGSGDQWIPSSHYLYAYDAAGRRTLEAYYSSYDAAADTWRGSTRTEITYDSRGNVTLKTEYTWSGGDWQGKTQTATTYNAAGKTLSTLRRTWRNGEWVNQSRMDYDYDASGKTVFTTAYVWSNNAWRGSSRTETITNGTIQYAWVDSTATWVYSKKTESMRDTDGGTVSTTYVYADSAWTISRRTKSLTSYADGLKTVEANFIYADSVWKPTGTRTEYTYDNRLCTLQARYQYADDTTLVPVYRVTYRYDADGRRISEQRYDYANGTWTGLFWYEYGYDAKGHKILNASYRWQQSAWSGLSKSESVYNDAGQVEEDISYKWVNNAWTYMFRHVYTYDTRNRTTEDILYRGNGEAWDPDTRYEYLYDASGRRYETRESEWYGGQWTLRNLSSTTYDAHNRQTATLVVRYSRGVLQSYERDEYNYFCGTCHGVAPAATICLGDSALFCGRWYSTAGDYSATLAASEVFYDSLVTWTLHVQSPTSAPVEQHTLCADLLPYQWRNLSCDTAGTYRDTAYYATGCDSVYYTLHLQVNEPTVSDTTATICSSDLPYRWYDHILTAAGTATRTIPNALGCDSTITLHLQVNEPTSSDTTATICSSDLPYRWYDHILTAAGTATRTVPNALGCDSTITLHLQVNPPSASDTTATICSSDLPYRWYDHILTAAGTATRTIPNALGCDSTITLHLQVNEPTSSDTTATICSSDLPYRWYDHILTTAGTATRTIPNAVGCDSTITLRLQVNEPSASDTTATICSSDLPYRWYEHILTVAGTATRTITNALGCDSTITLHLTVNEPTSSDTTATICSSDLPYRWYDHILTAAGTATRTIPNAVGCDSTITLHLQVNLPTQSDTTATVNAFELPYHWHGQTLTEEGVFTYITTNAQGCDSTVMLTLHVLTDLRMWISVREGEVTDSTYTMQTPDTIHVGVHFEPATAHAQVLSYSILEGKRLLTMHDDTDISGTLMLTTNSGHEGGTAVLQATAQVAGQSLTAHLTLHVLPDGSALPDVTADTAARCRLVLHHGVVYIERATDNGPEYYDLCGKRAN